MLSAETVQEIEGAEWFGRTTKPYLVIDANSTIRAVNRRYEEVTGHPRSVLLGEAIFDVFPDNPGDPAADGVANLSASFEQVFSTGESHWMGIQHYDVQDLSATGRFVHKVWAPVNSPIQRDGDTVGVLHHVEDVTLAVHLADEGDLPPRLDLLDHARSLWQERPALSFSTVLAVVASAHQMVLHALGSPHSECAETLARLRLQQLAGYPHAHPGPGWLDRELAVLDDSGPGVLDEDDCLRLLASQNMGRVAVSIAALPAIFPVHYQLSGDSIYFRSGKGTSLSDAVAHSVVAFEVDMIDPIHQSGWSVQVVGQARWASNLNPPRTVHPSAPERRDRLVKISIDMITGRRIHSGVPEG